MKILRHLILLMTIAGSGYLILPIAYDSAMLFLHEHSSEALVRAHLRFIPDERYNSELKDALFQEDIELANQIYLVGQEQNVAFEPELLKQLEDENSFVTTLSRKTSEFWDGAWEGEVKSVAGFVGSLTAIADVRDLTNEFQQYPEYDSLTVGLSVVGIAATVSSVSTVGATAKLGFPVRLGVTSVKMVRKAGKISKKFKNLVNRHIDEVIDKKVTDELVVKVKSLKLDNIDKRQFDEIATISRKALNPKALEPLKSAFDDMYSIQSHSGYSGLSRSLTVSDDFKDLGRLKKVSETTKLKMAGVIKLAPRLAKPFMNVLEIIYQAIAFLCGALMWGLSVIWYLFKVIRLFF